MNIERGVGKAERRMRNVAKKYTEKWRKWELKRIVYSLKCKKKLPTRRAVDFVHFQMLAQTLFMRWSDENY